jgi:uncharacterized protein (TIGR03437 family)
MQYIAPCVFFLAAAALPAGEFSTYIGDVNTWQISRLMVDASGNTYVAGSRTFDLSFDPFHPDLANEAIVAKLDSNGKTVLFAAFGGKGNDGATDIAVDAAGNIYVAGGTSSPNFPVRNALYPTAPSTRFGGIGFVTKFNPDVTQILFSTYFPARVDHIAVDSAGAVYVSGTAFARDFPTTPGLPAGGIGGIAPMIYGAYLTKLTPAGDRIVYSTVISGQQKNCGAGSSCFTSSRGASGAALAVDAAGNAYLAGNSDVTDLPTTPGVMVPNGAGAFLAKVSAAGSLAYLTYVGSGAISFVPFFLPATTVSALSVDVQGNVYATGSTWDPKLPFSNRFHGWTEISNVPPAPPPDVFALKLNPAGTALLWGSYLGGDAGDVATAATLDSAGNFWFAGASRSTEFPNANGWSTGEDFIVEFSATGGLTYSARYPTGTLAPTLAVDSAGLLRTATPDGVVSAIAASSHPAVRPWTIGPVNGHVAAGEVISIYGPHLAGPVFINDLAAPILYTSDQQINAVVPFEVAGQQRARIRIGAGPEYSAAVLPAAPQIFAPALNQDGTVNSPENPARVGSVMSVWVTGGMISSAGLRTGQIATGAQEYFVGSIYAEGVPVNTLYAGAAPALVAGIGQINFVVPDAASIVLRTGNYVSPPLPIYVTR